MADSICAGCGLRTAPGGIPLDRPLNASPECWGLHAEMLGFELAHPDLVRRFHQLAVDTYGAQHAGPPTSARSVVYGLVGLKLALEDGWTGVDVRTLHGRMGPVQPSWPVFGRPIVPARITVLDVVLAGSRSGSPDGHANAVDAWARALWTSWRDRHEDIRALARALVERHGGPGSRGRD